MVGLVCGLGWVAACLGWVHSRFAPVRSRLSPASLPPHSFVTPASLPRCSRFPLHPSLAPTSHPLHSHFTPASLPLRSRLALPPCTPALHSRLARPPCSHFTPDSRFTFKSTCYSYFFSRPHSRKGPREMDPDPRIQAETPEGLSNNGADRQTNWSDLSFRGLIPDVTRIAGRSAASVAPFCQSAPTEACVVVLPEYHREGDVSMAWLGCFSAFLCSAAPWLMTAIVTHKRVADLVLCKSSARDLNLWQLRRLSPSCLLLEGGISTAPRQVVYGADPIAPSWISGCTVSPANARMMKQVMDSQRLQWGSCWNSIALCCWHPMPRTQPPATRLASWGSVITCHVMPKSHWMPWKRHLKAVTWTTVTELQAAHRRCPVQSRSSDCPESRCPKAGCFWHCCSFFRWMPAHMEIHRPTAVEQRAFRASCSGCSCAMRRLNWPCKCAWGAALVEGHQGNQKRCFSYIWSRLCSPQLLFLVLFQFFLVIVICLIWKL